MSIRLYIAEDTEHVRRMLVDILGLHGFEIVGDASSGEEAVDEVAEADPDVVVMDLKLPELNGIDATREIVARRPATAVLVLTMLEGDDSVFAAMRAGARGYLLKGADRKEIARALETVASGEIVFSSEIASRVLAWFAAGRDRVPAPFPELTEREREILDLVARGLTNPAIAARLVLSEKTVRNHVSNVFTKLHVADRSAAVARARDAGLGRGPL